MASRAKNDVSRVYFYITYTASVYWRNDGQHKLGVIDYCLHGSPSWIAKTVSVNNHRELECRLVFYYP